MLTVFNKFNQIKHVGSVSLNMGANEVPEEEWDKVKSHPVVRGWIKSGKVEISKGDLENLADITPVEKAVEVVESTFDKDKLLKWLKEDDRKTTQTAIKKQLEYLDKEAKGEE